MKFWQQNLLSNMMHLLSSHMTSWCEGLENSLQVTSPEFCILLLGYSLYCHLLQGLGGSDLIGLFSMLCHIASLWTHCLRRQLLASTFAVGWRISESFLLPTCLRDSTSGLLICHVVLGFPLMPTLKALINTWPFLVLLFYSFCVFSPRMWVVQFFYIFFFYFYFLKGFEID